MNKIVHYLGLDVHKESIAVAIAPQNTTEVRRYGKIGGTLEAMDKLIKKLSKPDWNCGSSMKPVRAVLSSTVICDQRHSLRSGLLLHSFPRRPPTA